MKRSSAEISTGVFVLLGLAAIVWFSIQAGARMPAPGSTYQVNARFSNVTGLKTGSQIFLAGVPVGRVQQIRLDPQFAAIVQLQLSKDVQVPSDTIASIRTNGLLGDKFIALSPGADTQNLAPGAMITDTEPAVDLESLISQFAFGSVSSASPSPSPSPASAQ
jgi:phospholipid/cholesterol/gamma-HCH transport system substrate-binding protein